MKWKRQQYRLMIGKSCEYENNTYFYWPHVRRIWNITKDPTCSVAIARHIPFPGDQLPDLLKYGPRIFVPKYPEYTLFEMNGIESEATELAGEVYVVTKSARCIRRLNPPGVAGYRLITFRKTDLDNFDLRNYLMEQVL